eukprot:TRINITY_DN25130_c0_g2_i1.p1 TRINITY_DN25130_c0_g2~~TRINITY_DN25130_c0_g2_i1.p1  ORF type:complete len:1765 (-),score=415.36 TRINITY_DN25130_c0_g2_i1:94-5325(-)
MAPLQPEEFVKRRLAVSSFQDKENLLRDAISTENEYRGLFARSRESWEIPEIEDSEIFRCLPQYADDTSPRLFELGDKRLPDGSLSIAPTYKDFEESWDCFTESQLRFLDWSNVFAAGGSVAGCLQPLPDKVQSSNWAEARKKRRPYYHDEALPGSDVDLFLYGLTAEQAEKKMVEIYEAVQAANPYEVLCFRSAFAVTLVSQYPFRHIQIVLRLYNSPAEILMGFDVDSCACGFDGKKVVACQRTAMAFSSQANTLDMSRRSPSYEMRLSKYASRGFEVVLPSLLRDRVDPFLYEKRFDQVQGLARLLLLERLKTPEARFTYRMEQKLKKAARGAQYKIRREMNKVLRSKHDLARMEDSIIPTGSAGGVELSNYSTVFLPWGPAWTAKGVKKVMAKKDRVLNSVEFKPGGRVVKCTRKYKVHICAAGLMTEVIQDPFPNDPPIPDDVPKESLEQTVRGPVRKSWLVDNPGRQQIGSFNPITDGDWSEGAYLSAALEKLAALCATDDAESLSAELAKDGVADQLCARDFIGRSVLHVAALGNSAKACKALLEHPKATSELLNARLADGRFALHLASMHGFDEILKLILEKRQALFKAGTPNEEGGAAPASEADVLDIDAADWELKLSPLQYAVVFGRVKCIHLLIEAGAAAKKLAVHKDKNMSKSVLALCAQFACDSRNLILGEQIAKVLFGAGASTSQVDTSFQTIYHQLAEKECNADVLEMFLKLDDQKSQVVNVIDAQGRSPLAVAVQAENNAAVKILLSNGATAKFSDEDFAARKRKASGGNKQNRFGIHGHQDSHFSCPIFVAADRCDYECLRIFLEHDPSLATAASAKDKSLLDHVNIHRTQILNKKQQVDELDTWIKALKAELAKQAKDSYGQNLWELRAWMAEQGRSNHGFFGMSPDDDDETIEQKIAKIDKVAELIKSNGGESLQETQGDEPGQIRKHRRNNDASTDPILSYAEMQAPSANFSLHRSTLQRIPKGEQGSAHQLFEACFRGDSAALAALGGSVRVCTASYSGATPLWLAVLRGNVGDVQTLFVAAERQFCPPKPRAQPEEGDGTVTSQLRKLNNLDLAAGRGAPKDGKLSPDEMRERLARLEEGVLSGGDDSSSSSVSTRVPPAALLLYSGATFETAVRSLKPLLQRLKDVVKKRRADVDDYEDLGKEGESDSKGSCLLLSPLEVAIIQGDLQMTETLLRLAPKDHQQSSMGGDEGKTEPSEDDKHDDGADDHDGDDDEDNDEEGGDEEVGAVAEKEEQLSPKEVHCKMLCTPNACLGGLTALQLAIAVDRPDVYIMLVKFAEELALPLDAVAAWKKEVEDEDNDKDKTRAYRGHEGCNYHPLHLALWLESDSMVKLLLSGGADEALFGFLKKELPGRGKVDGTKPYLDARRWLKSQEASRAELSTRLLGPEAVDRAGRTALFYASSRTLPWLLEGCKSPVNLEHRLPSAQSELGVTALMLAAHGCDSELVGALMKAGCDSAAVAGKQNQNALHFVVSSAFATSQTKKDHFKKALSCAEVLLGGAASQELLFAPEAEHTPLMLAMKNGTPVELVRLLAQRMLAADTGGAAAFKRADFKLNTAMHLGATCEKLQAEVISELITTGQACKAEAQVALSATIENACGTTPLELVMERVSQVWVEAKQQQHFGLRQKKRARCNGSSKDEGEPKPKAQATRERKSFEVLATAAKSRTSVSFDAVQAAAQQATKEAQEKVDGKPSATFNPFVPVQMISWNFPRYCHLPNIR